MKKIEFEESRRLQYDLLKEIDRFCTEKNIRYFLAFGTLLGAVRHKGYIPWDDDTDVCMPRPDYDRFMREYVNSEKYSVYTFRNCKDYFYTFGRIKNNYTFNLQGNKKRSGVCVDIYPVEGLPSTTEEVNSLIQEVEKMRKKEMFFVRWFGRFDRYYLSFFNLFLRPLILRNAKQIEKKITAYNYEQSERVSALSTIVPNVVPQKYYGNGVLLKFENDNFVAPENYEAWLKDVYGNYMQLPPEENRVPKHWGNFYYY